MRALIESESETEFEYELAPKSNPVNACHFPLSNNHYFYVIKKNFSAAHFTVQTVVWVICLIGKIVKSEGIAAQIDFYDIEQLTITVAN